MLDSFFFNIWYKKRFRFFLIFLLPLSLIYYLVIFIRNLFYDRLFLSKRLDCIVISIGNINLGGTGKTPFLLYLIENIKDDYKKILVLTRGYGGRLLGEVGDRDGFPDEARMIKNRFPDVIVWAGKDRLKSYESYKKKYGKADIVILDDGFQHRRIRRDIDIVMVNGTLLFGNSLIFPSGPLREPISSIKKRSDLIILKDGDKDSLNRLKKLFLGKDILSFDLKNVYFSDIFGNKVEKSFVDKKNVAFCGIANPEGFKGLIEREGIKIVDFITFPDHIDYSLEDVERLLKIDADCYITTEKDAIKLKKIWKEDKKLFILIPQYGLNGEIKTRLRSDILEKIEQ